MILVVDVVASVAEDPVDGGHGGDGGRVTDPPGQQLLSDLPGEHAGVVRLDPDDSLHHAGGRHLLNIKQAQYSGEVSLEKPLLSFYQLRRVRGFLEFIKMQFKGPNCPLEVSLLGMK